MLSSPNASVLSDYHITNKGNAQYLDATSAQQCQLAVSHWKDMFW